jgi:hypothetical protein
MNFIIGAVVAFVITILTIMYIDHLHDITMTPKKYIFSQSSLHEIIKPLLPAEVFINPVKKTQSKIYEERTNVRVIIVDGLAYWIRDNKFYEANMFGADIDKESARVVDTIGMDRVQLDKMLFIMDKLREGLDNDSGSSGN